MVHINLRRFSLRPLYQELKDMLTLLDSLKEENKLWSSKYTKGATDLALSAIILWFTYKVYIKLGLKSEAKASLRTLESLLMVKLRDIKTLSNLSEEDLMEILQCVVTVLKYCDRDEARRLAEELHIRFRNEHKEMIGIINHYNPFTITLPSLTTLVAIYQKKLGYDSAYLDEIIQLYIESIDKSEEPADPASMYWISEVLLELVNFKDKYGEELIISRLELLESILMKKLASREDNLEYVPLDEVLWYYHTIENLIQASNELHSISNAYVKKMHNNIMKYITSAGLVSWKKTTYAEVLRGLRSNYCSHYILMKQESIDIDLVTLSLLIDAYDRMGKHIVTYVTDYDLRHLTTVMRISLGIGTMFIIAGALLAKEVIVNFSLTQRDLGLLSTGIMLVICGLRVINALLRHEIKKLSDLLRVMKEIPTRW